MEALVKVGRDVCAPIVGLKVVGLVQAANHLLAARPEVVLRDPLVNVKAEE